MNYDDEKRQHHRFDLAYPIRLFSRGGEELATAETLNISQGGTLFVVPADKASDLGESVNVTISMPASAYHSDDVVDFACQANIIRHDRPRRATHATIAVAFARPLELAAQI